MKHPQRPDEFEHDDVIKAISHVPPERLDELKTLSEKEGKDFISLVAAEALGITCPNAYLLITSKERASAKHVLFGYLYGLRTRKPIATAAAFVKEFPKVSDFFNDATTRTGRTKT